MPVASLSLEVSRRQWGVETAPVPDLGALSNPERSKGQMPAEGLCRRFRGPGRAH
jgi:hypothetical protein